MLQRLAERLDRSGSLAFDEFVELALYGDGGFYADGGGAGRRGGDFLTSPEVGPLFGAVVARRLDAAWESLGRPGEFVVVEAAAGRGALALAVLAARPACADALRYLTVERSAVLRARQAEHLSLAEPFVVLGPRTDDDDASTGPLVASLPDLPAAAVTGVVLANELLDNLAFRLLERTGVGWSEVRVARAPGVGSGRRDGAPVAELVELLVPADPATADRAGRLAPDAPVGARIPVQDDAADWLRRACGVLERGVVLTFDYAVGTTAELAARPWTDWVRTYVEHGRGRSPLDGPGGQDVTVEVAVDQLAVVRTPDVDVDQAAWLRGWGLDDLVDQGRRDWESGAARGDLAAIRGRSRAVEAEALCDPAGLGAFRVLEWNLP